MSAEELVIYTRKNDTLRFQHIICSWVVQYAKQQGIKQADVCRLLQSQKIKVSTDILCHLAAGRYQRQISIYTLIAICDAVGLNLIDFIKFPDSATVCDVVKSKVKK